MKISIFKRIESKKSEYQFLVSVPDISQTEAIALMQYIKSAVTEFQEAQKPL
jgi:cell division FtsZ-interacting protein ZapD